MHPAFSVIAFTTLSGAGYGLLFLLGSLIMVYNLIRTVRGETRAEAPVLASAVAA